METIVDNSVQNIDNTAHDVVQLLAKSAMHCATVESCTGGLVSAAITAVSGSSAVFDLGICTYANSAKNKMVGVPYDILDTVGAVSEECAVVMAKGVCKTAGAEFGVSTTGIAGPTGGTVDKPVGTVFIGISTPTRSYAARCVFDVMNCPEDMDKRTFIRKQAVAKALSMLRDAIVQEKGINNG